MSIRNEIARLRRQGDLLWLPPKRPGQKVVRRMFLARDVYEAIMAPEVGSEERMSYLRADLDRFSTGGRIVVGNKKHKTCFMKQLDPADDEVWEVRSREPRPSLRLIGAFACPNFYVGLRLYDRTMLGDETSRAWRDAILSSKTDWQRMFLTYERHRGDSVKDYISKDAVDVRTFR